MTTIKTSLSLKDFTEKNENKNSIVIALGDPAGIGTEITLKALGAKNLPHNMQVLLVGCKENIKETYEKLISKGINYIPNPNNLDIIDIPLQTEITPGIVNKASGSASFNWLINATNIVLERKARALVTAPI